MFVALSALILSSTVRSLTEYVAYLFGLQYRLKSIVMHIIICYSRIVTPQRNDITVCVMCHNALLQLSIFCALCFVIARLLVDLMKT
jgi:hypothetical protein